MVETYLTKNRAFNSSSDISKGFAVLGNKSDRLFNFLVVVNVKLLNNRKFNEISVYDLALALTKLASEQNYDAHTINMIFLYTPDIVNIILVGNVREYAVTSMHYEKVTKLQPQLDGKLASFAYAFMKAFMWSPKFYAAVVGIVFWLAALVWLLLVGKINDVSLLVVTAAALAIIGFMYWAAKFLLWPKY